jgi:hypothetical protein
MKFVQPPNVTKISRKEAETLDLGSEIFPIGNLYTVDGTDLYFRILSTGGRWSKGFTITTNRGFLCRQHGTTNFYFKNRTDDKAVFDNQNQAVEALLVALNKKA